MTIRQLIEHHERVIAQAIIARVRREQLQQRK